MAGVLGANARAVISVVFLFFAVQGPAGAQENLPAKVDELRVVLDRLGAENSQLKSELTQREKVIQLLTENLAIARTESELFQKKWAEARLRAQTLGVNFTDQEATGVQRQLADSLRALYLAEAERQKLAEQLRRLLGAIENNQDLANELARTRELLAVSQRNAEPGTEIAQGVAGTLDSAQILDVNRDLQLVVLNVGLVQGARVGMPFVVRRGDRIVAELKIAEVRQKVSGALIERVEKNVTLSAGDVARVTKS